MHHRLRRRAAAAVAALAVPAAVAVTGQAASAAGNPASTGQGGTVFCQSFDTSAQAIEAVAPAASVGNQPTWTLGSGRLTSNQLASALSGNRLGHTGLALGTSLSGDFTIGLDVIVNRPTGTVPGAGEVAIIWDWVSPAQYRYASIAAVNDASTGGIFEVTGGVGTQQVDIPTTATSAADVPAAYYTTRQQLVVERRARTVRVLSIAANGATTVLATQTNATAGSGRFGFGSAVSSISVDAIRVTTNTVLPARCPPQGYTFLSSAGRVYAYGTSTFHGPGSPLQDQGRYVGIARTPTSSGYFIATSLGEVSAFGDARARGGLDTLGVRPVFPVVAIATTPTGGGYWLAASDGGVFAFGDAPFLGSMGGQRLNAPVVDIAATPTGRGYWLVAADGGIFAFGDAPFLGSTGSLRLNQPIVGMAATPSGKGYWFVARDGGVFSFGDARFYGSGVAAATGPIVGMIGGHTGAGYLLVQSNGRVLPFGSEVSFLGDAEGLLGTVVSAVA